MSSEKSAMRRLLFSSVAVAAMGVVLPVYAHHSGAMFDHDKTVTLSGTVKEFQYTYPHSWLIVLIPGADGEATAWGFESEGPSTLVRAGIKAKTFQPGDKVSVLANPLKDGRPGGLLISVTTGDGTTFTAHAPAGGLAPPAAQPSAPTPPAQ
jgi:hypothetical protein